MLTNLRTQKCFITLVPVEASNWLFRHCRVPRRSSDVRNRRKCWRWPEENPSSFRRRVPAKNEAEFWQTQFVTTSVSFPECAKALASQNRL